MIRESHMQRYPKPCSIVFSIVLFAASCSVAAFAQKRGFQPEDVYLLQQIADPQVSPDGKTVAYTVTQIDSARNPRWGPNGTLAFIADALEPPADAPQAPEQTNRPETWPPARPEPANP